MNMESMILKLRGENVILADDTLSDAEKMKVIKVLKK